MKDFKVQLQARGLNFALVVSRFNENITKKLLEGAIDALLRHGAEEKNIHIYWAPGSFELPFIVALVSKKNVYDGIVALGCVVRGETSHYEYIAQESIKGIHKVMEKTGVPVGLGILTVDTTEQALERAGGKRGNKGEQATLSVIELIQLKKLLSKD